MDGTRVIGSDAPAERQAVLGCWLRNDLTRAAAIARQWTGREPGSLDAWIMLAETCTRQHRPVEALESLRKAADIDGNHPLFWRALCQAALLAGAFYTAHGAVAAARYTDMPPKMVAELEQWLKKDGLVDTRGKFLKPEASEEGWQDLVPRLWQPNREEVRLCWGRCRGRILVYPLDFSGPAAAFASGQGPEIWFSYPAAVEKLSRTYENTFLQVIPPPEIFNPFQAYFLQASLHLCGFFPVQTTPQKWISQTPVGALEIHVFGSRHFCIIENDSLVAFLCTFLPHVFNGRISLTGPNEDLEVALPWLTRI
ncbi:MAG: tetratricopeptide repeat protein [Leptolinea sp.]|nr:tetratricopeptide repeat protein [Leptolinea sp.]